MVALTRSALLVALVAGITLADRGRAPQKHRRQYANSSISDTSSSSTSTSTSSTKITLLPSYGSTQSPASLSSPATRSSGAGALSSTRFSYNPSASSLSTVSAANDTCTGKTLNVLGASLDWWYGTYTYIASTYVVQYDADGSPTGWTLEANPTPFDVTSALQAPSCTTTSVLDSAANASQTAQTCSATPPPLAAATTTVEEIAYSTVLATTGTGAVPNAVVTPAPAAITIPNSGGNFSAGTPFVFFSRYEIMTKFPTTYGNGSVGCGETTSVYNMANPFSFEYSGGDVNGSIEVNAGVTGDVAPAFLGVVNVTNVIAGSWVAAPTVAVVVSKVVAVSQSVLATPTPTLPSGQSSGTTQPAATSAPTAAPNLAASQLSLQLPSSTAAGSSGSSGSGGSGSGSGNSAASQVAPGQTSNGAGSGTSAGSQVAPGQTSNGAGSGGGAGASVNTGSPTNALQVLTQATATYPSNALAVLTQAEQTFQTNPTAAAILSGIGSGSTAANAPVITVGGSVVTANSATQYVVAGSTLTPGGTVVVSGSTVSLAPGATAVVVNGQTTPLAAPAATGNAAAGNAPAITVGGSVVTANSATQYIVGGSTLTPGGTVVVSGSTVSLAPGATAVVVNGQTTPLAAPAATGGAAAPLITAGGSTFSANAATQYSIGGSILTPGGSVVYQGSTISLASGASAVVINGQTTPLSTPAITAAPAVITVDGQVVSATGSGNTFVVSGQTLSPGGIITINGASGPETMWINAAGNELYTVRNGVTGSTALNAAAGATATAAPVLTVGGQTFTAIGNGATYVIGGKTLTPGGSATVTMNGQVYVLSLSPGTATTLEIEMANSAGVVTATSYETLFPATRNAGTVTSTALAGGATAHNSGRTSSIGTATAPARLGAATRAIPAVSRSSVGFVLASGTLLLAIFL